MTSGSFCTSAGGAFGDLAAEIQRDDAVGDRHHQAHVMLDQQQRHPALVADASEQLAEFVDFVVIEAAGGLIEQQQLRPRGQRPRQLDAFLRPERQIGDAAVRHLAQFKIVDDIPSFRGQRAFLTPDPRQPHRSR